jgi:hypothetical protein
MASQLPHGAVSNAMMQSTLAYGALRGHLRQLHLGFQYSTRARFRLRHR